MKRIALYLGIVAALVASCSIQEENFVAPQKDDVVFYASFEQPTEMGTRVYANENLYLRWTADDRVSIFNKLTYNQQYMFTGNTGANAGGFKKVESDEFVTGNTISHVVSVYPYQESTEISESETLTLTLPAIQHYAENTFGLGANTMVSVSEDNVLQFKNVGGYLRISLYGKGTSVSSIMLKGNNGEKLAGQSSVTMPLDSVPTVDLSEEAAETITLTCDTPITLGATADESTDFWFVVPPVTFTKGFTIRVTGDGGVFMKSTEKTITIERNNLSKMSPIEVEFSQPKDVIYYSSSDGNIVTPNTFYSFGANIISNVYVDDVGIMFFDGDVTSIGQYAFLGCASLTSITIPESVTSIGQYAFMGCTSLTSITIPESVTSIGGSAFYDCTSMASVTISEGVTSIGDKVFYGCTSLASVTIPKSVTRIGSYAFYYCTSLVNLTIPESVAQIDAFAFASCSNLASISVHAITPPWIMDSSVFDDTNNCPIFVPEEGLDLYKKAEYWCDYSDRIKRMPGGYTPEFVDLGLSVKWSTCNIGTKTCEGLGEWYAWGEVVFGRGYNGAIGQPSTYKWWDESDKLTKYCTESSPGSNGFYDNKTILDLEDDAAFIHFGENWRMPTADEWTELIENCTVEWATINNQSGCIFTSKINGNNIFLPAAGYYIGGILVATNGLHYWSSSLSGAWSCQHAFTLSLSPEHDEVQLTTYPRYNALSIRAVHVD